MNNKCPPVLPLLKAFIEQFKSNFLVTEECLKLEILIILQVTC